MCVSITLILESLTTSLPAAKSADAHPSRARSGACAQETGHPNHTGTLTMPYLGTTYFARPRGPRPRKSDRPGGPSHDDPRTTAGNTAPTRHFPTPDTIPHSSLGLVFHFFVFQTWGGRGPRPVIGSIVILSLYLYSNDQRFSAKD